MLTSSFLLIVFAFLSVANMCKSVSVGSRAYENLQLHTATGVADDESSATGVTAKAQNIKQLVKAKIAHRKAEAATGVAEDIVEPEAGTSQNEATGAETSAEEAASDEAEEKEENKLENQAEEAVDQAHQKTLIYFFSFVPQYNCVMTWEA